MSTHDLCPIIDALKVFYADFSPVPNVSYLECSNGVVSEKEVARDDLQNVRAVAENKVKDGSLEMLLRLVYLRRRIEIDGEKGSLAYQLLSSILHGRSEPTIKEAGAERIMTAQEINMAHAEIKKEIAEFSLDTIMMSVSVKPGDMRKPNYLGSCAARKALAHLRRNSSMSHFTLRMNTYFNLILLSTIIYPILLSPRWIE